MSEHYSTRRPTSDERYDSYDYHLDGHKIEISTVSGVFGKAGLDRGSQVLIEYADLSDATSLLDLGCGTGVIGIGLKARFPQLDVTFADVNERAIKIARENARKNRVKGRFVASDGFKAIEGAYDAIALNPPQSAGKAVCERLIKNAEQHLSPGGRLLVVARHNKGGKSLSAFMEGVYGNLDTIAKKSGYRVYVSRRSA